MDKNELETLKDLCTELKSTSFDYGLKAGLGSICSFERQELISSMDRAKTDLINFVINLVDARKG